MKILRPATLAEALPLLNAPDTRAVAGGSALQMQWSQGVARPEALVDIAPLLPHGIITGGCITIGAATPLAEIENADLALLSQAARDVAAPNIRRLATLGGTIGFGAGCLIPALLVLRARVETTSGTFAVEDYLSNQRGIITKVHYDAPSDDARIVWRKTGLRAAFTPAIIVACGIEQGNDLRLAIGGGVVRPQLLDITNLSQISDPKAFEAALLPRISAPDCALRSGTYRARVAARVLAWGLRGVPEASVEPKLRPESSGMRLPLLTDESQRHRWHIRPDMPAKVAGAMSYLTDHRQQDMLVARILRAAHPHARILSIDTSKAEALDGIVAVVTANDIKGLNGFGIVFQDQPALCCDKVRYLGDAVACVAARDAETAAKALGLIDVVYDVLPVVTDPLAALQPDAPLVHASGNLVSTVGLTRGDVDAAFAQAVYIVEDTYVTPRQMHGFMETEGGYVVPNDDGSLLVACGGQHGARDREQLSRILDLPQEKIRVVTSPIGGGFGGKDELTIQPALALVALKAGRPVRLQLSRAESVLAGMKRNPMRITMRTACDAEGKLLAQQVELVSDCGAYASLSPGVLETAMEHAAGPYIIENIKTRGRLVYTNNGTCGAFRGFGANQMAYAMECQMDRLAALCGLDPVTIRRRNLRKAGSKGYLGQRVAGSERLSEMLDLTAASPLWTPPSAKGEWIEGTGMSLIWQGNGLGTIPDDRAAGTLRLATDGKIEILCGMDEMGQGLLAGLVAATADRLGIARDDVRPVTGDTGLAPDAGSTSASRGGYVVWQTVENLAPDFTKQLIDLASKNLGISAEALHLVPHGVAMVGDNQPRLTFTEMAAMGPLPEAHTAFEFPKSDYTAGNARLIYAAGANVVRVAINRVTGQLRVLNAEMHTGVGPVIDLASYLGQMEGGVNQGLGFTLTEDILMRDGRLITENFDTYVMPSVRDICAKLAVTALETLDPDDPYGPRGAGELGIGGLTPAIANAVADAIGHWPNVTPIPPEMILKALPC